MPRVICQVCGEVIGIIKLYTLSYPLDGGMFFTPDVEHGVPAPFPSGTPWSDLRCPFGRMHRPLLKPDQIWTDEGMVVVPQDGAPAYIDSDLHNEVTRDSIIDRSTIVSEEAAAVMVRKELANSEVEAAPAVEVEALPAVGEFVCSFCGREFKSKKALAVHFNTHTKGWRTRKWAER